MRIIIFLIAPLFIISVKAQEKEYAFSLEKAIHFALENNRNAINATRTIDAAEKQKWETTAIGLPQIDVAVDYQNFLKQPVSLVPAEFFGGVAGDFEEVVFGTRQNVNATASLRQLIFNGSYLVGLQAARVFLEISKNAKEKTDLEIRKAVVNAYGNVLLAEESIKILEKNKSTLEKTLNETQKVYENGLTEEENVEQLQITFSTIENSYNNALRLKDIAYKMLNLTLGIPIDTKVTLTENLEALTLRNIQSDLATAPFSVENAIDYKIAKNNERSQELLLKLEKSKALPSLNAFINGGYQGFSNDFSFLQSNQRWFGISVFGVGLNVPVFSSFARGARTQRAKIEFEKAKTQLTETEQQLQLQLESARSDYQFSIEQYHTSKKNLELAERIESKNQIKYGEGVASGFDLRQAQTQLYATQQEYLRAMLHVITNKADLEVILNTKN
jgi:outer membrane protein TolC